MLFCLAGIGLLGQVFHSTHPLYMAGFLWCLMTASLFWLSANRFSAFIWLLGLGLSAILLFYEHWFYYGENLPFNLILGYALLALALALGRKPGHSQAAAVIFTVLLLAAVLSSEIIEPGRQPGFYALDKQWLGLSWALLTLIAVGILAAPYRRGQKIILFLGWIWLLGFLYFAPQRLSFYLLGSDEPPFNPVGTFSLLAWLAAYAVVNGRRRLLLLWLLLAGARVGVIFLLAFYGLWGTGLGLLLCGALLIAIPLGWKALLPKLFPPAKAEGP
jgi:hypothetical protein